MWWIVLTASAALIFIGFWLLLRDYLKPRALAADIPAQGLDTAAAIDYPPPPGLQQAMVAPLFAVSPAILAPEVTPLAVVQTRPAGASATPLSDPTQPGRLPAVETHWQRLKSEVDMAVAAVNQSMAPLFVSVAKPGEPTWSLHNRGFGDYRRVRVGGESVAWLRLELAPDMSISAHLRSHEARHDMLNRVSTITRPLTASRIGPMLAECLAALAAAAPRLMPQTPTSAITVPAASRLPESSAGPTASPAELYAGAAARDRGPVWPQWLSRPRPNEVAATAAPPPPPPGPSRTVTTGWGRARRTAQPATVLIDTAVTLVNSAFAETGARLVPASDAMQRDPVGPDSRALSIDVAGTSVGLMLIEPMAGRIDIAVGVANLANFDTARRRSHELDGLTVHPLAETIATCAWPAIAAAKSGA